MAIRIRTFAADQRFGVRFSASHQRRQRRGYRFAQAVIEIVAEVSAIRFAIGEEIFQAAQEKKRRDATWRGSRTRELVEARSRSLQSWPRDAERGIHCLPE